MRWLTVLVMVLAVARPASAAEYEVGVARSDLSWKVEAASPQSSVLTFSGLHSRLWAKAIVVKPADGKPFALVRTDTLLITGDLYEGVLQRVARTTGLEPDRVLVAATHTHTANNGLFPHAVHSALYRSFQPDEREFLADRIAQAVTDAFKAARPAKLAAGSASLGFVAFNRRYTENEHLHTPPFANDPSRLDPEIGVLRFDDAATGKPLAVLMNHGVHPVVTISEPLLSSDLVGFAERELENSFGREARPMAIWFTGAQGDQDPIHVRFSYPEAEWAGGVLGRAAGRVAVKLRPAPISSARVSAKLIPLPAPGGPSPSLGVEGGGRVPVEGPAPLTVPSSVRLQVVELASPAGGRTALLSWPGEPIRDIGVSLKAKVKALGFDRAYVLGLANDWAGYWLTPQEYDRQRYEWTLMFYGRESSPYVEEHAVDLARSLATGAVPAEVPLPPKAAADRELTVASASVGAPAEPAPGQDPAAAVLDQPASVERGRVTRIAWQGGSPRVARDWFPQVRVERLDGDRWVVQAREGAGEVLLLHEGESRWSARWQPTFSTPAGTYRLRVAGNRQGAGGLEPYELTSERFAVSPCRCLRPQALRMRNAGKGVRLAVSATYVLGPDDGYRLLPGHVRTGRPVVHVRRRGRTIARVLLRYRRHDTTLRREVHVNDLSGARLPVTTAEPVDRGTFVGRWRGRRRGVTFRLAPPRDGYGNRPAGAKLPASAGS